MHAISVHLVTVRKGNNCSFKLRNELSSISPSALSAQLTLNSFWFLEKILIVVQRVVAWLVTEGYFPFLVTFEPLVSICRGLLCLREQ